MTFNEEYIKECYEAFKYSLYVNMIMDNLNKNSSANVRSYMDAAIDDLQEEINQVIGEEEHTIHNARVIQLKAMYTVWYKLFELTDTIEYELL
jgi:hypothetical protein